jgi:hypothetical protein
MNRRKFCLSSVAAAISGAAAGQTARAAPAASTPGVPTPAASSPVVSIPSSPLYRFIYDRRFIAGRAFGAAAEQVRSTAGSIGIDGDITALWSRDLRPRWSAGDGAIAGMATARTLFCLEQLAKEHWMRVVFRADHAISSGHEIAHRLTGSQPMMSRITAVLAAGDWPTKMPAALATCSGAVGARGARGPQGAAGVTCLVGSAYGHRSSVADENLVSFVIA